MFTSNLEVSARRTQLLAKVERQQGGPTSRAGTLRPYLKEIGLNKNRANECERIAAIPEPKLTAAFEERAREGGRPSENRPGSGQFRAYLREIGLTR
jgi:hypothetical protein